MKKKSRIAVVAAGTLILEVGLICTRGTAEMFSTAYHAHTIALVAVNTIIFISAIISISEWISRGEK